MKGFTGYGIFFSCRISAWQMARVKNTWCHIIPYKEQYLRVLYSYDTAGSGGTTSHTWDGE